MKYFCVVWLAVIFVPNCWAASKPNIVLVFADDQGWTVTSVPMMLGRPDSNLLDQRPEEQREPYNRRSHDEASESR